ncbi:MAG: MFS transporter, partial [Bacteroidota bacterium]|nr:MFS transporter [Candidatus Kapabacteria bacterium]MDW8219197.1 MFS transporter [Bacteroidota bacterium]
MLEMQRKLTHAFYIVLSLPATAMGFALCVQISALSWIMSTKYHLNIEEVGFVWASGPIAGIVGQVLVGFISDNVWFWGGRRRPFILVGGILAALMLLALPNIDLVAQALGTANLLWIGIAVALLLDLSINVSFNPTRSIIADVTPEGDPRTKGYTWMQTISGMFGVLAYIIGAIWGNYALIAVGIVLVLVFSIIPVLFVVEPRTLYSSSTSSAERSQSSSSGKQAEAGLPTGTTDISQFIRICIAHAFSWLGVQTMFVYMFAYAKQILPPNTDDASIGRVIAISFAVLNTVGFILPVTVLEPFAERFGRVRTHLLALAIMALGYVSVVLVGKSAIILYSLMVVIGVGWAAVVSLPFAIMTEKVDKNRMGLFMGIFNLSVVLPQLMSSLVIGKFIQDAADKSVIFVIAGVSLAISSALWLLVNEVEGGSAV